MYGKFTEINIIFELGQASYIEDNQFYFRNPRNKVLFTPLVNQI